MVFAKISHCTKPNGAVSRKERVTEAVPFASGGDICVLPEVKGVALSDSSATVSTEVTPKPSFTPDHVIVTTTILVIVEVLSVQDMVALALPSYAATLGAKAGARSMAVPRDTTTSRSKASRSRRFIAIPPSVRSRQHSRVSDRTLSEDTQHRYSSRPFLPGSRCSVQKNETLPADVSAWKNRSPPAILPLEVVNSVLHRGTVLPVGV